MSIYFDPDTNKAFLKHGSFDFKINGQVYNRWYDLEKDCFRFDCDSNVEQLLDKFVQALNILINKHSAASGIKELEVRKFALKYLKADIKIDKELHVDC
jgi:hypothetical protein